MLLMSPLAGGFWAAAPVMDMLTPLAASTLDILLVLRRCTLSDVGRSCDAKLLRGWLRLKNVLQMLRLMLENCLPEEMVLDRGFPRLMKVCRCERRRGPVLLDMEGSIKSWEGVNRLPFRVATAKQPRQGPLRIPATVQRKPVHTLLACKESIQTRHAIQSKDIVTGLSYTYDSLSPCYVHSAREIHKSFDLVYEK